MQRPFGARAQAAPYRRASPRGRGASGDGRAGTDGSACSIGGGSGMGTVGASVAGISQNGVAGALQPFGELALAIVGDVSNSVLALWNDCVPGGNSVCVPVSPLGN